MMTRTTWRALAGVLALSLGGIVVCAKDSTPDKAVVAAAPKPQCPACPVPCCPPEESTSCPHLVPQIPPPSLPEITPVVHEPAPPMPIVPPAPPAVATDLLPKIVDVPMAPTPIVAPNPIKTAVVAMPYKIRMEMVNGLTHLELVRGEEVALRVQCEKVDMQMPHGGLHALGKVRVSAPGIEVQCNRLVIGWQTNEIAMEGQVRILCQNGNQKTEMAAESVCCRLNGGGNGFDFSRVEAAPGR